jgi:transcriptional accessory protein Tex/SPT6
VKVGQKVKVTVVAVDLDRNRIALTMRTGPAADRRGKEQRPKPGAPEAVRDTPKPAKPAEPAVPKPGTIAPNGMRFR